MDPSGRLAIFAAPAFGGWISGLLGGAAGAIIGHEVWPHVFPNDIASDKAPSGGICEVVIDTSPPNDHCDEQYERDIETCRAISRRRGSPAGARCYSSASARLAACIAGQPIPPLNIWNN